MLFGCLYWLWLSILLCLELLFLLLERTGSPPSPNCRVFTLRATVKLASLLCLYGRRGAIISIRRKKGESRLLCARWSCVCVPSQTSILGEGERGNELPADVFLMRPCRKSHLFSLKIALPTLYTMTI